MGKSTETTKEGSYMQKGYTLTELIVAIIGLAALVGAGFAVYAAIHFVLKLW